jgi:Tol biopolymer transport system component
VAVLALLLVPGTAGSTAPSRTSFYLAFIDPDLQVSVVRADGSRTRQLTRGPDQHATPVWSPDGRKLVFARTAGASTQLFLLERGAAPRALTRLPGSNSLPAWSPDGRNLAFVSTRDGSRQIYLVNIDGSGLRRLTAPPGESTAPAWSPDGRHIAFVARRGHPDWDLYVMRPDGSVQIRLTTEGVLQRPGVLQPVWTPDGSRIAYVVRVGRAEQGILSVPAGGGRPARVTTGYAPAWSPDGQRVAFAVARVGDAQIYVMDADGRRARRLTPTGVNVQPAWSPNSRLIAFLSSRDGDLALWVMNPDGSDQRRLAPAAGDLSTPPVFTWRPRPGRAR